YDEDDKRSCIKGAMIQLEIDTTQWKPPIIAAMISNEKNALRSPQSLAKRARSYDQQVAAKVYRKYETMMKAQNAMDFDDLLVKLWQLFRDCPDVLEEYRKRFRYILIDEYQDTNNAQYAIAHQLASGHKNICATGDPDQAIYGWRGANIQNILDFEEHFPGAKVVRLEQNYRSTKNILHAAHEVIKNNKLRKEKTLWTENPQGARIRVLQCEDEHQEAQEIGAEIASLLCNGTKPHDVAIFYRTNAQSRNIEQALLSRRIPYTIVGGLEFFERREIKDVLAYLRVCANPADEVSLERIINVPARALGPGAVLQLKQYAFSKGVPLGVALDDLSGLTTLSPKAAASVTALAQLFRELRQMPARPVVELVKQVVERTGYLNFLKKNEEDARVENVEEFVNAAADYDAAHADGNLQGFLDEVALIADIDKWDDKTNAVSLMTLHSAKGLEFPAVFIAGMEEGLLPHRQSLDTDEEIEEERRLCYVGITRAKRDLTLTHTYSRARYGSVETSEPSRFLSEMPPDVIDQVCRAESASGYRQRFRPARRADVDVEDDDVQEDEYQVNERDDFAPGDRVRHPDFGIGRIADISGVGKKRRATVAFDKAGQKRLMLEYAKLEKLG
ncbi:MAG: DUF3553 domain-containing protein, partial [Planctomycetes bacterium]|nr:DUF3553 domain-containing protein [Planctomycetota bacterium]